MRAKTVNEVLQMPFRNNTRNQPIRGTYPLSRIQYEDADKPEDADWDTLIPCEACGNPTNADEFTNGVCKKCETQGFWQDRFGHVHKQNSRVRHKANESFDKNK